MDIGIPLPSGTGGNECLARLTDGLEQLKSGLAWRLSSLAPTCSPAIRWEGSV
jgi:hypothetical protein